MGERFQVVGHRVPEAHQVVASVDRVLHLAQRRPWNRGEPPPEVEARGEELLRRYDLRDQSGPLRLLGGPRLAEVKEAPPDLHRHEVWVDHRGDAAKMAD